VVITMLADNSASRAVYLGPEGLFAAQSGTDIFIEMSTVSPAHLAQVQAKAGSRVLIDAPDAGATQAAKKATLMIMAGATKAQIAPVSDLFAAMEKQTIALGQQGAGSVMKLAINTAIHGLNQSACEALNLAVAFGIALPLAYDVLEALAAGAPILSYGREHYLDEANQEVSFTVALAEKNMRLATQLATELGVNAPQAALIRDTLLNARQAGFEARDMASILQYLRAEKT
jgi:3-hydroxyisobutyrate dehydrogenase-like beta-hydroxyacid dehydrogenase